MVRIEEIAPPVNDGERLVLARLREELPSGWGVVSNFEVPSGNRMLECDAVAFSPAGWAFLIETKADPGQITGNDREWSMPSITGDGRFYVSNPVHVLRGKVKKLASFLSKNDVRLCDVRVFPLVVIVSEVRPALKGASAGAVALIEEMVGTLTTDPRSSEPDRSPELVDLAIDALCADARRSRPRTESVRGSSSNSSPVK